MSGMQLVFCLLLLFPALLRPADGIGWLAVVGMSGLSATDLNNPERCIGIRGFTKKQVKLCKKNSEHMESIRMGAEMALSECRAQFLNSRWNCSLVRPITIFGAKLAVHAPADEFAFPGKARKARRSHADPSDSFLHGLGAVMGSREAAFVHAISSGGVAHKVTRDCSAGLLSKCGCDSSFRGESGQGFQWAGCSDNVHYGGAFSRKFVDAQERRKRQTVDVMLMNLHNNEAGRQVIEQHMGLQCKCHGVSGSCELKTCWRAIPNFRKVGSVLKDKFDGATEVKLGQDDSERSTRAALVPVFPYLKRQTKSDLVFLKPSPDYCRDLDSAVSTAGRTCNIASDGIDGCDLLCCHRGFVKATKTVTERCECKFKWCCEVKCKECRKIVHHYTCR